MKIYDGTTFSAVKMMMYFCVRVETPWIAMTFNHADEADFGKRQQRPIDGIDGYVGKFISNRMMHRVGGRMVFRFDEFPINSKSLRRYLKIVRFAYLFKPLKLFGCIVILHVVLK